MSFFDKESEYAKINAQLFDDIDSLLQGDEEGTSLPSSSPFPFPFASPSPSPFPFPSASSSLSSSSWSSYFNEEEDSSTPPPSENDRGDRCGLHVSSHSSTRASLSVPFSRPPPSVPSSVQKLPSTSPEWTLKPTGNGTTRTNERNERNEKDEKNERRETMRSCSTSTSLGTIVSEREATATAPSHSAAPLAVVRSLVDSDNAAAASQVSHAPYDAFLSYFSSSDDLGLNEAESNPLVRELVSSPKTGSGLSNNSSYLASFNSNVAAIESPYDAYFAPTSNESDFLSDSAVAVSNLGHVPTSVNADLLVACSDAQFPLELDLNSGAESASLDFLSYKPHLTQHHLQQAELESVPSVLSLSQPVISDLGNNDLDVVELNLHVNQPTSVYANSPHVSKSGMSHPLGRTSPDMSQTNRSSPLFGPYTSVTNSLKGNNKQREQALQFRAHPHPVVAFGFGGRFITAFPRFNRPLFAPASVMKSNLIEQSNYTEFEVNNAHFLTKHATRTTSDERPSSVHAVSSVTSIRPGPIQIYMASYLSSLCASSLSSHLGPVRRLKGRGREQLKSYVEQQVCRVQACKEHHSSSDLGNMNDAEYVQLLWKFLAAALSHLAVGAAGETRTAPPLFLKDCIEFLLNKHASKVSEIVPGLQFTSCTSVGAVSSSHVSTPGANHNSSFTVADSLQLQEQRLSQLQAVSTIPSLILENKKQQAVELAIHHQMFDYALLLSADNDGLRKQVVSSFCHQSLPNPSLLRTLFLVQTGMAADQLWPPIMSISSLPFSIEHLFDRFPAQSIPLPLTSAVPSSSNSGVPFQKQVPPMITSWRSHVALVLSSHNEYTSQYLLYLGDYLWAVHNHVHAAHLLYLLATCVSPIKLHLSSRIILLGANHRRLFRQVVHEDHFIMSEILQIACINKVSDIFSSVHLAPFQLIYLERLIDFGFNDMALRYCEDLREVIKTEESEQKTNANHRVLFSPLLSYRLNIIEHRLRILLNAPVSAPVSAKIVHNLLSVLDKGINLLVGDQNVSKSNSTGTEESCSQWGPGGYGWDHKFERTSTIMSLTPSSQEPSTSWTETTVLPRSPSPSTSPSLRRAGDSSFTPMIQSSSSSLLDSPTKNSFLPPVSHGMRLSRSGDSLSTLTHQAGNAHMLPRNSFPSSTSFSNDSAVPSYTLPNGLADFVPESPAAIPISPVPGNGTEYYNSSMSHPSPSSQSQSSGAGTYACETSSKVLPPNNNGGTSNQESASSGLMKRFGAMSGMLRTVLSNVAAPAAAAAAAVTASQINSREANLEEDHSFCYDESQGKYIFVDKHGHEVPTAVSSSTIAAEGSSSVNKAYPIQQQFQMEPSASFGMLPPALAEGMKQKLSHQPHLVSEGAAGTVLGLPTRPPPSAANVFSIQNNRLQHRYALSVGNEFIITTPPPTAMTTNTTVPATLIQPAFPFPSTQSSGIGFPPR